MTIFKYNLDINKNSYMNWRIYNWNSLSDTFLMMSEGYFKSCNMIVEELLNDNTGKRADIVIFPLLFDFIHGIELSLKAILMSIEYLVNKKVNYIQGGHDIKQLYNTITKRLKNNNYKDDIDQFTIVECFINDIYSKTNLMDFPRYPIDSKKNEHFFVSELDNVVIDLEEFASVINECSSTLIRMGQYYNYLIEQIQESGE